MPIPPRGDTNPAMSHASHPEILGRLKRAHGHLNKVIAMLEEGRDCVTVAQQLQAVESAVIKAKRRSSATMWSIASTTP